MTTYLTHPGSFAKPAPTTRPRPPRKADDRRGHALAALAAATALTGTVLAIAATTPSSPVPPARTSGAVKTQAGTVTAVSPTSITVRSADGSSRNYLVNGATRVDCGRNGMTGVKVGDPVAVTATVTAGTADATDIVDSGGRSPVPARTLLPESPLARAFQGCW